MMNNLMLKRTPIPYPSKRSIESRGGKPVAAFVHQKAGLCVAVIASLDPSGESGKTELHASVTASIKGVMVRPKRDWLRQVKERLGMKADADCRPFEERSLKGVHLYSDKWDQRLTTEGRER